MAISLLLLITAIQCDEQVTMDVTTTNCRQYDITQKPDKPNKKCMKCNIDTFLNQDDKCMTMPPEKVTDYCIWYENGGFWDRHLHGNEKTIRCKKCDFGYMRVITKDENKKNVYKCMKVDHCPKFEFTDIKDKPYEQKEYD